jgi:hypothetical protein
VKRFVTLVFMAIFLAACGAETAPKVITEVPTSTPFVALPSAPPPQQAEVVSILPTSTPPPTSTRPPTLPPGGATATSPLRPTFTNLPPSATPTNAPTEVGITIDYFTTISETIIPGDNVTLAWRVLGATDITIYRVGDSGQNERQWAVQREGQITVGTNPARTDSAEFVIVAQSGNQLLEERLLIEINCSQTWFFDPPPNACANQAAEPSLQVEQTFEGGRMIWVANNQQIYVFFADEQQPRWLQVADTFEDGQPESDDSLNPPEGRFQPVRGFGLVWRSNPNIRDRLGWATEPESAYEGMIQANADSTTVYMRTRDGGIIGYQSGGRGWEFIPSPGE